MEICKKCTGCGLCSQKCPTKSIRMIPDKEGFLSPCIDNNSCIKCNLCVNSCPQNTGSIQTRDEIEYYSLINSDSEQLRYSSSGGVFSVLVDYVLSNNGFVCGCIYDDDMVVRHVLTNDHSIAAKMRGSKYVQSETCHLFPAIKQLLNKEKLVLYTGTPCQIAALLLYIGNNSNKLITVDVLCHGVPSPLLFKRYIQYLERRKSGKVKNIEFRNKDKKGWGSENRTCITIEKKNGSIIEYRPLISGYFCSFFYGDNLRMSCYECKYASKSRISDVTIGDFWGAMEKYKKSFSCGISIVSVNTERGKEIITGARSKFSWFINEPMLDAIGSNTSFVKPVSIPCIRDDYYDEINAEGYRRIVKNTIISIDNRKKIVKTLYGALVPGNVRGFIRKVRGK